MRETDDYATFSASPFLAKWPDRLVGTLANPTNYVETLDVSLIQNTELWCRPIDIQGIKSFSVQFKGVPLVDTIFPAVEITLQISNNGDDWFDVPGNIFTPDATGALIDNLNHTAMFVCNEIRAKYLRIKTVYVDEITVGGNLYAYLTMAEV
jgi:hypothetical protein